MNDPRPLPGEPLGLDLVDTVYRLAGTTIDLLETMASTRDWLVAAGLGEPDPGDLELVRDSLLTARRALRDALERHDVTRLNDVLRHGRVELAVTSGLEPRRTLVADSPHWQPAVAAGSSVLDLLGSSPERVRNCENPACMLWFYDATRNGTRRWCSMATCGNRMKARRHYERVKAL